MHIPNASIWKRSLAKIIDLIIIGLFTFFAAEIIVQPIWMNSFGGSDLYESIDRLRQDSGLFLVLNHQAFQLPQESYDDSVFFFYHSDIFDYESSTFFQEGLPFNYANEILKINSVDSLFELVIENERGNFVPKVDISNAKLIDFWSDAYQVAIINFNRSNAYINLSSQIARGFLLVYSIGFFMIVLLLSLIMYFLFKPFGSLGNYLTKLIILTNKDKLPSFTHFYFRNLFTFVFELYTSILFYFIPLLITFAVSALTKKQKLMHDLLFSTYVVEMNDYKIFSNL
jgi:hypothetical protein